MKKTILNKAILIVASLPLLGGCVVYERPAQPPGAVVEADPGPPPSAPTEVVTVAPGPLDVWFWAPGCWEWRGSWVWVPGRWRVRPHPGAVWVVGGWGWRGHHRVWVEGHWH